ncbi:basic proline-rich protein-like [Meles meles]|uniref:basic proline-rich protein-like n=1 Tax=Meles meles TaxID=9662 RepID=UPI001E69AAD8|nr:basic proline-rich protein-like [Meles meles]
MGPACSRGWSRPKATPSSPGACPAWQYLACPSQGHLAPLLDWLQPPPTLKPGEQGQGQGGVPASASPTRQEGPFPPPGPGHTEAARTEMACLQAGCPAPPISRMAPEARRSELAGGPVSLIQGVWMDWPMGWPLREAAVTLLDSLPEWHWLFFTLAGPPWGPTLEQKPGTPSGHDPTANLPHSPPAGHRPEPASRKAKAPGAPRRERTCTPRPREGPGRPQPNAARRGDRLFPPRRARRPRASASRRAEPEGRRAQGRAGAHGARDRGRGGGAAGSPEPLGADVQPTGWGGTLMWEGIRGRGEASWGRARLQEGIAHLGCSCPPPRGCPQALWDSMLPKLGALRMGPEQGVALSTLRARKTLFALVILRRTGAQAPRDPTPLGSGRTPSATPLDPADALRNKGPGCGGRFQAGPAAVTEASTLPRLELLISPGGPRPGDPDGGQKGAPRAGPGPGGMLGAGGSPSSGGPQPRPVGAATTAARPLRSGSLGRPRSGPPRAPRVVLSRRGWARGPVRPSAPARGGGGGAAPEPRAGTSRRNLAPELAFPAGAAERPPAHPDRGGRTPVTMATRRARGQSRPACAVSGERGSPHCRVSLPGGACPGAGVPPSPRPAGHAFLSLPPPPQVSPGAGARPGGRWAAAAPPPAVGPRDVRRVFPTRARAAEGPPDGGFCPARAFARHRPPAPAPRRPPRVRGAACVAPPLLHLVGVRGGAPCPPLGSPPASSWRGFSVASTPGGGGNPPGLSRLGSPPR